MLQYHSLSNAGLSICFGTSAHETGIVSSFNTNSLRSYTPDGKRRRHASDSAPQRAALQEELLNLYPSIRRIKLRDTGILFILRIRTRRGRMVYLNAYNLKNLRGIAIEAMEGKE